SEMRRLRMTCRFSRSLVVGGLFVAAALAAPGFVAAQARATTVKPAAAKTWTVGRTPDGQPDLQGFWTNTTYTPLQRPNNVTKEFFTREELEEVVKRAATEEAEQTVPGTIPDVHYDFTQFGLDRSQGVLGLSLRTSMIVDPPDGKLPPLSAEGRKKAAERAEARKRMGGRWDGDTLVVESTNFTDKTAFQGASENMRLTERFTRVDEDTIRYQFTVEDPATWTRPWSAELLMKKTVGPIFEHACHEGNYGL